MPTNAAGQVIVNPNVPLGLNDFKQIYTGNGATPAQNASNLLFNAPTAGKSYMDDQWSKLGIPQAPEDYFAAQSSSPPSEQAPPGTGTPAGAQTGWPTFPNEAAKQVALATGAYDPSFPSPQSKATYLAAQAVRANDATATAAEAAKYNPIMPRYATDGTLANPAQVLQGQTAGDTNGYSTLVLQSMQGIRNQVGVPANLRTPLQPYVQGYGSGANSVGGPNVNIDKLDRKVYFDPQFQQILARDPSGAAATYQRFTGRSMQSDIQGAQQLQQEQLKTGLEFTQKALANHAYQNSDGTWMVANPAPPPPQQDNGLSLEGHGQSPRLIRQMIPASPTENSWMNQHFTNVTGRPLPKPITPTPAAQVGAQQATQDPDVQKQVATVASQIGRPLNPKETFAVAQQVAQAKAGAVDTTNPHGSLYSGLAETRNAMFGLTTPEGGDVDNPWKQAWSDPNFASQPQNQNWWGQMIRSLAKPQTYSGPLMGH